MDIAGEGRTERRLAAILAADVVGYSRLMGADEEGTHLALKAVWREVTDPCVKERRGRVVKTMGDGLLVEFASVVDAVLCAVDIQRKMTAGNQHVPTDRRIIFRIGINLGDIIIDQEDIFGDGVNVAARLEALAEPGGICISQVVHDQVRGKLDIAFVDQGERQFKNIARPVRAFRIWLAENAAAQTPRLLLDKPAAAAPPFPSDPKAKPDQFYFAPFFQRVLNLRSLSATIVTMIVLAGVLYFLTDIRIRFGERNYPSISQSGETPGGIRPSQPLNRDPPLSPAAEDRGAAADLATRSRIIGDPVFFDRDRVSLPQSAAPAIDRQAAFLRDNPTINVTIKTYCSPGEGKREGTETLAALRVNQIRDALKARGIAADRIAAEPGCQVAGADRQPGRLARAEDPRAELLRN